MTAKSLKQLGDFNVDDLEFVSINDIYRELSDSFDWFDYVKVTITHYNGEQHVFDICDLYHMELVRTKNRLCVSFDDHRLDFRKDYTYTYISNRDVDKVIEVIHDPTWDVTYTFEYMTADEYNENYIDIDE